jgi:hypothetical protein
MAMIEAPSDRDVSFYAEAAAAAAPWFDRFVFTSEVWGPRLEGDVGRHMAEGLQAVGIAPDRIDLINDYPDALGHLRKIAKAGDLLVLLTTYPKRSLDILLSDGGHEVSGMSYAAASSGAA